MFAPERPKSRVPDSLDSGAQCITFGRAAAGARTMVYPPSSFKTGGPTKVDACLRREYLHGINASIQVCHIRGDAVFAAGSLCIVQDLGTREQRFFEGHNNDVTSLAVAPRMNWVCSGQQDPKGPGGPYLCIWSPLYPEHPCAEVRYYTPRTTSQRVSIRDKIAVSKGHDCKHADCCVKNCVAEHSGTIPRRSIPEVQGDEEEYPMRFISCIAFSPNNKTLVFFGADDTNTCLLYNVSELPCGDEPCQETVVFRKPTCTIASGRDVMTRVTTNHDADSFRFFTTGSGVFKVWEYHRKENRLGFSQGSFGRFNRPKIMSGAYSDDPSKIWLVGDNGFFFIVNGVKITEAKKLSSNLGCVARVLGKKFLTCSIDGHIMLGEVNAGGKPVVLQTFHVSEFEPMKAFAASESLRFNSIAALSDGALLTTKNHALLQLTSLERRPQLHVLTASHRGENNGLAIHPHIEGLFATGDSGKEIRFWNHKERRTLVGKVLREENEIYSLDFSQAGDLLAVGMDQSALRVYNFTGLQIVYDRRLSAAKVARLERLSFVAFSPNDRFLACACWDSFIYLLRVTRNPGCKPEVSMSKVLSGNSAAPTHLMFSADSQYVCSNSKDAQILCWRINGERQSNQAMFRDTEWTRWRSILGWPVIGIWDRKYDITDINAVAQSPCGDYIASADDEAKIRLFRFPAACKDQQYREYGGHGAHVTNLRWCGGNVLISLGGDDKSIVQWRLTKEREERRIPKPITYPWTLVETGGDGIEAQLGRIHGAPTPEGSPLRRGNIKPSTAAPLTYEKPWEESPRMDDMYQFPNNVAGRGGGGDGDHLVNHSAWDDLKPGRTAPMGQRMEEEHQSTQHSVAPSQPGKKKTPASMRCKFLATQGKTR